MSATIPSHMTADEFIAWAMQQPAGTRYELAAGRVVAMAPERSLHGLTKARLVQCFMNAIEARSLPCQTYTDCMAVRIDAHTVYEPDVLVRCGERLDDEALDVPDPLIVVEVVSPSSQRRDTGAKLEDYFRLPSVRHYVIVKPENKAIIHHHRDNTGSIMTHIIRDGRLALDPPGLSIGDVFAA